MKLNLIQIQERYIARVDAAMDRWSHRKDGGQSGRTRAAAYRQARTALLALGFTGPQTWQAIKDADDMLKLQRMAE